MSKSKLTLIIDGNWLLMSRFSVMKSRIASDLEICNNLKITLIKSIKCVLNQFPIIDNIIFVADGGSWRTSIELPNCLKTMQDDQIVTYKGTRIKDEDEFNWELLFNSYEDFINVLQSTGINTCREQGIEGDDWCYWWSTYLNSQGTNCIIWTKDNDLKQLVKMNKDHCFTCWWNKDTEVYVEDFPEEELDFFFNQNLSENEKIFDFIKSKTKGVIKINPKNIVLDKIIKGDVSDNVLPIILRKSKTGSDKKFKVSTKDINYDLDYNNSKQVYDYLNELVNSKNYIGRIDKTLNDIVEHFKYNRTLVSLYKESYPQEVLDKMSKYNDYNLSKDITIAESQIMATSNRLNNILEII